MAERPFLEPADIERLTYAMLRKRFDAARITVGASWQFRDLRAKAATDIDDLRAAYELV